LEEPLIHRGPPGLFPLLLLLGMVAVWHALFRAGTKRRSRTGATVELGPIESGVAGLLALILAFSFNMASLRFEHREDVIVREANAIETAYLRCAFLTPSEQAGCRTTLARYAQTRVALFEARDDRARLRELLALSQSLQGELWAGIERSQRELDRPSQGKMIEAANALIDLHTERVAARLRIVPQEVTLVVFVLCLAWSAMAGYAFGLARNNAIIPWTGFATLACLVIFVSLDLDRPTAGFVRPRRGQAILQDLAVRLHAKQNGPAGP
jgi:hypothetical protein